MPSRNTATTETPPWWGRTLPITLAVAALLTVPSLFVGFVHDDTVHRLLLEGKISAYGQPRLALYDFTPPSLDLRALVDNGRLPWFTGAGFSMRFLRPGASLLMALEHELFGRNSFALHVHSMLWLVALVAIAARLYQRWFAPRAARLSTIIFACSGVFAMPTAWIASRHALVAAALGGGALLSWVHYREDHWTPGLGLSLLALTASLLASEAGLTTVVFLCCYELGRHGLWRGLKSGSAILVLGAAYLLAYAFLGYGVRGSSMYVSPFDAPGRYLLAVFERTPLLCGELFAAIPSTFAALDARVHAALAVLGVAASVAVFSLLFWGRRTLDATVRRHLAWQGSAALASLPALVGAMGCGRVLGLTMLGTAPLLAHALLVLREARAQRTNIRRWLLSVPIALLCVVHFGISPLLRITMSAGLAHAARLQKQAATTAEFGDCAQEGDMYLVNGSEALLGNAALTLPFHRKEGSTLGRVHVLSMLPQAQRLHGISASSFELEVLGGKRNPTVSEQVYRSPERPLQAGMAFEYETFEVEVIDTTEGLYRRARFTLKTGNDARRSCLLTWRDGGLRRQRMPAPGEIVDIPFEPRPYGI